MSNRRLFTALFVSALPIVLANCSSDEDPADQTGGTGNAPATGGTSAAGRGGGAGSGGTGGSSGSGTGGTGGTTGGTGGTGGTSVSGGTGGTTGGTAGSATAGTSGSSAAGSSGAGASAGGASGASGAGAGGAMGGAGAGGASAGSAGGGAAGSSGSSAGGSGGSGGGGTFTLTSSKITAGSALAADFTCAGDKHSPPFEWSGVPAGTMSLAMVFVDKTIADMNPTSAQAYHSAIWDIPAGTTALPEDLPLGRSITTPVVAKQFSPLCDGYLGPCPPGGRTDTYEFRLFALPVATLTLPGSISVLGILNAIMDAEPLGTAVLSATSNASGSLGCAQ